MNQASQQIRNSLPCQEVDLCFHLQTSLEAAFHRRRAGLKSWGEEWGEAFFRAYDELPQESGVGLETIYLAASKTLALQARHGHDRPLAHRILLNPEAFLLTLAAALQQFDPT